VRTLLMIFLLLVITLPAAAATIEGRIVDGDEPVSGLKVFLYRDLDFTREPEFIAAPSDAEGYFRVEVSPGSYALFASDEKRRLFAFCGRNPVTVDRDDVWAGLQVVPVSGVRVVGYDDEYSAAIEGVVEFAGKPLAGAYVYLYLDAADDLKGQGYRLSMPTGADGAFAFDGLPESSYFLMARKRMNDQRVGPVLEGDYLGHFAGNPLVAKAGTTSRVVIPTVRKVRSQLSSETITQATGPVVTGRVLDAEGHPLAGLHVFAYTDRVIGHKRPAALSAPTGNDGRFRLSLGQPGTFFIGARQEYGDSPTPGELFGMYDKSADHGLTVKADQVVNDMTIIAEPISLD